MSTVTSKNLTYYKGNDSYPVINLSLNGKQTVKCGTEEEAGR